MSMSVVISRTNSAHSAAGADTVDLRLMKDKTVVPS